MDTNASILRILRYLGSIYQIEAQEACIELLACSFAILLVAIMKQDQIVWPLIV